MKQYFYQNQQGGMSGPVSGYELPLLGVTPETLVWSEGMSEWKQAKDIEELASLFLNNMPSASTINSSYQSYNPKNSTPCRFFKEVPQRSSIKIFVLLFFSPLFAFIAFYWHYRCNKAIAENELEKAWIYSERSSTWANAGYLVFIIFSLLLLFLK